MSKTSSALVPEKRLDVPTVCSIVAIFFAIAAVLAGWNATHAQPMSDQSHSVSNFLICGAAAFISIFFFYNAFAATDLPPAMTTMQEARARDLYSSLDYGPVLTAFKKDLDEKSKWPQAVQRIASTSNETEKLAGIESLLTHAPDNLVLAAEHAVTLEKLGRYSEAETEVAALLQRPDLNSGSRAALNAIRLGLLARSDDKQRLVELLKNILIVTADPLEKAFMLDSLCCVTFYKQCPQFFGNADGWSELALELQPNLWTLKGTRGAVLVELGREAEAAPLLRDVFDNSEALNDKGLSGLYLGICAKRTGNFKAAKKWFRRAHELWPTTWLIERIKTESQPIVGTPN